MPTIITHAVFSAAASQVLSPGRDTRLLVTAAMLSVLPDIDVIAFAFGIPYGHPLGHRGLTHSIAFACVVAAIAAQWARRLKWTMGASWTVFFASAISHPLLDALTNGGKGVAFFAPFSNTRFFFPFRPIEVSPIGLQAFLSSRGVAVLLAEIYWIWVPTAIIVSLAALVRRQRSHAKPSSAHDNP